MKSRVYGILGIASIMANWNADFSGYPKTISDGTVFGSDKALKYTMKKMWDNEGKKVLYIKSLRFESKKGNVTLVPNSLKERYQDLFSVGNIEESNTKEILRNLFQSVDVKNFGATFAVAKNNISITGAVQIGQGFNKYEGSVAEVQQILSPFRDDKKEGKEDAKKNSKKARDAEEDAESDIAKNSTLGNKIVSNEAHYFYPFAINPMSYKEYVNLEVTEGYTREDYENFKRTALVSATAYATNAKEGCENEFAFFVEGEMDLYLPNLSEYVRFAKKDEKNIISIHCGELLEPLMDRIFSIEIYYNPLTTILDTDIRNGKIYNIVTRKEVKEINN